MAFIDKRQEQSKKELDLSPGSIIEDDHYFYELMNVNIEDKKAFKTFEYFVISDKLNDLQRYHSEWHEVVED